MPPLKSLQKLATEACINGIRHLHDIGDAPYHLIRPVLTKIGNPMQLKEIEDVSPQIIGADEEIWLHFIKRDIPGCDLTERRPRDPANWWRVYRDLKWEADEAAAKQTAALKAVLDKKAEEKEENKLEFDTTLKVPKRSKAWTNYEPRPKSGSGKHILHKARREARESGANRGMIQGLRPRNAFQGSSHRLRVDPVTETSAAPKMSREEAAAKRERALAQARVHSAPAPVSAPPKSFKRKATSVLLPAKRRRP